MIGYKVAPFVSSTCEKLTIASAVESAVVDNALVPERSANLLRLAPEVIDIALLVRQQLARGDQNIVHVHPKASIRHVQRVVQHTARLVVGKAIQVPIRVATEHDGRLLRRRLSHHFEVPVLSVQGVGNPRHYLAWESFLAIGINKREGDAVVGVRNYSEVAPVPAIWSTVERVNAIGVTLGRILVGRDVVRGAIDFKGTVLYAVGIAAGDAAKVRVLLVNAVVGGIVEPADDITLNPVLVLDHEIGDGCAVGNEGGRDAVTIDPEFAVLVWLGIAVGIGVGRGGTGQGQSRHGESRELRCPLHGSITGFKNPIDGVARARREAVKGGDVLVNRNKSRRSACLSLNRAPAKPSDSFGIEARTRNTQDKRLHNS
jgi:hypothetical protein